MGHSTSGGGSKLEVVSLSVQNLRGFTSSTFRFDQQAVFLVGPNNAGKTSLLRLLDLLFNWDLRREFQEVTESLLAELLPARETRNAARRLTLGVRVNDGRRHGALSCRRGIATLRLTLTLNDRRLRANLGDPGRGEEHDEKAEAFLLELRSAFSFVLIPAGRSADSGSFPDVLLDAITQSLSSALQKPGKGATKAERDAKKVLESLGKLSGPISDFWSQLLSRVPSGWVDSGAAVPVIDRQVLARFVAEQVVLSVTTGRHDVSGVPPAEVGSGLQSILDLELRRLIMEHQGSELLLAVEEPEVFLHPAAQRRLGRDLSSGRLATKTFVSTHSPLIIEESPFQQVALVHDHAVSQPHATGGERASINTALLTGRGAEVLFSRSVLLVEGPGDREYWESLRRRLAFHDPSGAVDNCYVLEVGNKSRFSPWIRLLRSYPGAPLRWTAILDADGADEIGRAMSNAGLRLSDRQREEVRAVREALVGPDLAGIELASHALADVEPGEHRVLLAPGDLESMMCAGLSPPTTTTLIEALGLRDEGADGLAVRLGTKHRSEGRAVVRAQKGPWMREVIGRLTPGTEIDQFALRVLKLWLEAASSPDTALMAVGEFAARA